MPKNPMQPETRLLRRSHSPDRPYALVSEREPTGDGRVVSAMTVFLTAAECPIGCNMCDLWQNTLSTATPIGAIPRQIDWALQNEPSADWIKLYNSGNFFDSRSIPEADYESIARQCDSFSRVVVENHPRIGRDRAKRFRDMLSGQLEVAVGLETVQPRWLDRLGKRMTRDEFDRYAGFLAELSIDLRVFLIIGVPGVEGAEAVRWARLSVRHAVAAGARHVSLIPARRGHGWGDHGEQLPTLSLDMLSDIQSFAIDDAGGQAAVTIDLWDVGDKKISDAADRIKLQRLKQINLSQRTDIP